MPQSLALTLVDSKTGEPLDHVDTGLEDEVDLDAAISTAIDFSLGDELLELQSLVRDDVRLDGRRETLLLAHGAVLFFVVDPLLDGATLVVICRASANLGLILALVRQSLSTAGAPS
ncbi:MAG: hypothetical protein AAGC60_08000 [Acidobacteriota bacterium]